jgi:cytochrome c oxidase assembly protein subunit 15
MRGLRRAVIGYLALVALTVLSGGLVAGLDAGFIYTTFPLMGEGLMAAEVFDGGPLLETMVADAATVQFEHRVLAVVVLAAGLGVWAAARRADVPAVRIAGHALLAAMVLQFGLGIATLLTVVAVPVAAAHQAGALVLLTAGVVLLYYLRPVRAATG